MLMNTILEGTPRPCSSDIFSNAELASVRGREHGATRNLSLYKIYILFARLFVTVLVQVLKTSN